MNISDRVAVSNKKLSDLGSGLMQACGNPFGERWHSESLRHHTSVQALFVACYNFAGTLETLKICTSAMASMLTDYVWTIKKLV
jgi:hypothetical protein